MTNHVKRGSETMARVIYFMMTLYDSPTQPKFLRYAFLLKSIFAFLKSIEHKRALGVKSSINLIVKKLPLFIMKTNKQIVICQF